jgi:hypothetical protein
MVCGWLRQDTYYCTQILGVTSVRILAYSFRPGGYHQLPFSESLNDTTTCHVVCGACFLFEIAS